MLVQTQRAKGPQILASQLYAETWNRVSTRNDPRVHMQCLVWETIDGDWWSGPSGGTTELEENAYAWQPVVLFERGNLNAQSSSTVLCFLEPITPPPEIPAAVMVIENWHDAMAYIDKHQCEFIIMGKISLRYLNHGFLRHEKCRVTHRNLAGIFAPEDIVNHRFGEVALFYEMLPDDWKPPKVLIPITNILQASMIEALKVMPTNEVIRTQIWSIIKSKIPDDKKTYDEIKSWIEENYDPKPSGLFRPPSLDDPLGLAEAALTAHGFDIEIDTNRPVWGICNYSAVQRYNGVRQVPGELVERAAREADGNAEHFSQCLHRLVIQMVRDEPPEDAVEEGYEYHDHDHEGSDFMRVTVDTLMERALEWLLRYHPDLAEALDPGGLEDSEEDDPDDPINQ